MREAIGGNGTGKRVYSAGMATTPDSSPSRHPLRVLFVCEKTDGYGGWYTYTRDLAAELGRKKHHVAVCTAEGEAGDHSLLPRPIPLLTSPWKAYGAARRLTRLLRTEQPDIIHITVEPYALLVPFLPAAYRARCVLTVHGSYGIRPLQSLLPRLLMLRAYRQCGGLIAVSGFTKEAVTRALRERGETATADHVASAAAVIHNGITLPPWQPRTTPNKKSQILLVGGVKPRKGVLEALEACAVFARTYAADFHFHVVGSCPEKNAYVEQVRSTVKRLGLTERVTFTGQVSDDALEELYRSADLYLMPSTTSFNTFEGYGIVFIEANARGVPCIGPDTSGAAEAISEGRSGYHADPADPEAIAEKMRLILLDRSIDPAGCRAWAEAHDVRARVRDMEDLYARVPGR